MYSRLQESRKGLCPGERDRQNRGAANALESYLGTEGSLDGPLPGVIPASSTQDGKARLIVNPEVVVNTSMLEKQTGAGGEGLSKASSKKAAGGASASRSARPGASVGAGEEQAWRPLTSTTAKAAPAKSAATCGSSGSSSSAAYDDDDASGWSPLAWLRRRVFSYSGVSTLPPADEEMDEWPEYAHNYDVEAAGEGCEERTLGDADDDVDAGSTNGATLEATGSEAPGADAGAEPDDGTGAVCASDRLRRPGQGQAGQGQAGQAAPKRPGQASGDEDAGPLPPRAAATGHTGDGPGGDSIASLSGGEEEVDVAATRLKKEVAPGAGASKEDEDEEDYDLSDLPWLLRVFAPPPEHLKRMMQLREAQYRAYGSYGLSSGLRSSPGFSYGNYGGGYGGGFGHPW